MTLIFCLSNLFIPTALTIIKNHETEQVVLYTYEKGIRLFFEKLNIAHLTIYFRADLNPRRPLFYLRDKRLILNEIADYNFDTVYFFHNSFGGFENWLITKLSSRSQILFVPIFNDLKFRERWTLGSTLQVLYSMLVYKTEVRPLYNGQVFIYKMDEGFFKKVKAKSTEIAIDHEYIKERIEKCFVIENQARILLLTGTIVELNHVDEQEYTVKLDDLIENIGKDMMMVKAHPRYPNKFSKENELDEIPAFIPANVLLSKFDVFIGYTTSVVAEAAQNGRIGISLVNYLEPVSKERQKNYRDYLLNNLESGTIYFPENLDELLSLLRDKKIIASKKV